MNFRMSRSCGWWVLESRGLVKLSGNSGTLLDGRVWRVMGGLEWWIGMVRHGICTISYNRQIPLKERLLSQICKNERSGVRIILLGSEVLEDETLTHVPM